jgi:hypothetical protein
VRGKRFVRGRWSLALQPPFEVTVDREERQLWVAWGIWTWPRRWRFPNHSGMKVLVDGWSFGPFDVRRLNT